MISLALPFTLGWIVLRLANSFPLLLVGRFTTGFAGGAFAMAAPGFIAEVQAPVPSILCPGGGDQAPRKPGLLPAAHVHPRASLHQR